jgi:hypothetical protein
MATFVSVLYHRWSSRCFQVMALAEDILATIGLAHPAPPDLLDRLEAETRELIAESEQIGDSFDRGELGRIARDALEAAERLRSVIERTPLALNHPLRALYDEFADVAEVFALAVDPQTGADLARAVDEAKRGESVPWEQLRERTG